MENLFQIVDCGLLRKRLGKEEDGGYVVPLELLTQIKHVTTFGVGPDISFELDVDNALKKAGKTVWFDFWDGTVESLPGYRENFCLTRSMVDGKNVAGILKDRPPTLWKFDIEGAELEFAEKVPEDTMRKIPLIVCEIHAAGREAEAENLLRFITGTHTLFHIHANNHCSTRSVVAGRNVCSVFECTFVRNDLVLDWRPYAGNLPIAGIDF